MNQKGNILFLILIAVALFAALSYAITGSSRNNASAIGKDKAKIAVSQMLQYASQLEQALNRLTLINGCTETQFSFESAPFDNSDLQNRNTGAPSDFRCHIFHPLGGGVSELTPPEGVLNLSQSTQADFGEYIYTGNTSVRNVGTDCLASECNEIVLFLPHVNPEACAEINKTNDVTVDGSAVADDGFVGVNPFRTSTGLYRYDANYDIYDSANEFLVGKRSGCISSNHNPGGAGTHFYYVLKAR
jgi:hypothetical protein